MFTEAGLLDKSIRSLCVHREGYRGCTGTHCWFYCSTYIGTHTRTHFLIPDFPISSRKAPFLCILSNVCYRALSRLQPFQRLPSTVINNRRVCEVKSYTVYTHTKTHTNKHSRLKNAQNYVKANCLHLLIYNPEMTACPLHSHPHSSSYLVLIVFHPPLINT